jgi:hypothetical protein
MLSQRVAGFALYVLSGAVFAHATQFLEAPQYATGANPQAVASGDFNGDGTLDLVVANSTSNTVSVLLGNGNGTYRAQVTYPTGVSPEGVAVADFNGDGYLDFAVTNSASNTISIFLGNGDGTFKPKVDYATGNKPQGVAVGNFSGNSTVDLAVTNAGDNTVGVLLGQGDGTFKAQATYRTGVNPYAIAVGDFNNDGIPDLAIANNNNNDVISVLLGNGNGTFQAQLQYPTGNTPVAVALGDFNGDGNLDIAVADQQGNTVSILLGNGKGAFATHVDYPTSAFPTAITATDLNGDGNLDLAVSSGDGNTVTILWGNGDGTFQGQLNCGTGDIPYSVISGDFNNDGHTDLAVANSGSNSVSIILNNGNKTFQSRVDYPAGTEPFSVAAADFNGNGFLDLAVAASNCSVFPNCGPGFISIILGNGDGTFEVPSDYSTGTETDPYSVAIGDFNGDGIPDIAVANYATNTVSVLLGVGNGTFLAHLDTPVGREPASLATGDFNGDGNLDLAVANFDDNTVSILLGNGDGSFKPAVDYSVGNGPVSLAAGYFGASKTLDLVVVNETDNDASILLGNGDGTFREPAATYPTGQGGNPLSVVIGDFNGDGNLDLAVADFRSQQVSILLGNGNGTFQAEKGYPTGSNPSYVVAADFNGDGKLDLALASTPLSGSPGNVVSLLLGNGDGTFGAPVLFGTGSLSYSAAAGDFNGDGAVDLAVANGGSNTVSVLLNTQGTQINVASSNNPSLYGQSVTFTTTVNASLLGMAAAPTGTITIKNGATVLASGPLVNGVFSASTASLQIGKDSISVTYSGDLNYQAHTITVLQTVRQGVTSTVLLASLPNPSSFGQAVAFTATISPNGAGTPTGTVTFSNGATTLGSSAVNSSGAATLSISNLPVGVNDIVATYSGNTKLDPATSQMIRQSVQKANTTTNLRASSNAPTLTLTATVSSAAAVRPAGSITFFEGSTLLGTEPLNGSGVATLSLTALAAGNQNISASYDGDVNFNASSSSTVPVAVGFAISGSSLSPSPLSPGSSADSTITVIPSNGFDPSGVSLTCAITPAVTPAPTCSLTPLSVADGPDTARLTVTTVGASASSYPIIRNNGSSIWTAFGLLIPALLLGAGVGTRDRRQLLAFCLAFVLIGGCLSQMGCGNSSTATGKADTTGTPAGNYTIIVSGTANGMHSSAPPLMLTVR